jgi:hypothetical protein
MSKVFNRSTTWLTTLTFSPARITAASAACTATTAAIAFALSGLSAVPV